MRSGAGKSEASSSGVGTNSPHWTGWPSSSRRSTSRVRSPPRAAALAARAPAGPAPTTRRSYRSIGLGADEHEVLGRRLDDAQHRLRIDPEEDYQYCDQADGNRPTVAEALEGQAGGLGLGRRRGGLRGVQEHDLDDAGVVEDRGGAVEHPRDRQPDKVAFRLDRRAEEHEFGDEADREGDTGEAEQHEREGDAEVGPPQAEPPPVVDAAPDPERSDGRDY